MKYSQYSVGDTVEIENTKYTLAEDRIAKGKDKKKALTLVTVLSIAMMVGLFLIEIFILGLLGINGDIKLSLGKLMQTLGIFVVAFLAFIVVHELLHYAAYRFLGGTPKDKLIFGFIVKQGMAYCVSKVPNTVKASRLSLMMPIYVIIIPMFILTIALGNEYLAMLTAAFFSGSAGDLWYMWTLRKTDKDLYMIEEEPEGKNYELGYYVFQKQED